MSSENKVQNANSDAKTATDWEFLSDRVNVIKELKKSNKFVDAMLITSDGGKELVHISVLSTLSSKLTEIMNAVRNETCVEVNEADKQKTVYVKKIFVPKMSKNVLKILVDCAYSGVISSDFQGIHELLTVAEEYEMKDVIQACCTYLIYQLNVDNCVELLQLGFKHEHRLRTAAWNVIRASFQSIVEKNGLQNLTFEQLYALLDEDELNVKQEETVWLAIQSWITVDVANRKYLLTKLLKILRYGRIKSSYLKQTILCDPLLQESNDAVNLVQNMIKTNSNENVKRRDGYTLPVSSVQKHIKPRIPHEIVFAIGGWLEGVPTTLVETYDIRTNKWFDSKISHNFPRAYHGVEILHGTIYIIGGTNGQEILSTVHSYDPCSGKWHQRANMYEQRCYVSTAILHHEIYAMGGHNGNQRIRTVEKYDHETNQWQKIEDMNLARSDASAAVYKDKIYIAGGLNEQVIENSVEMYNSEDKTWSFIQPMNSPRTSLLLIAHRDSLYALGGNNGFERLASVERYDFKSNAWTPMANMNSRRSTFSGCVIEDKIMVVGGYNGHTPISKVEVYDETQQKWTQIKSMKHDRSGLAVCVIKGLSNNTQFTYCGYKGKTEKSFH